MWKAAWQQERAECWRVHGETPDSKEKFNICLHRNVLSVITGMKLCKYQKKIECFFILVVLQFSKCKALPCWERQSIESMDFGFFFSFLLIVFVTYSYEWVMFANALSIYFSKHSSVIINDQWHHIIGIFHCWRLIKEFHLFSKKKSIK